MILFLVIPAYIIHVKPLICVVMFKRILLPFILLALALGFWFSPSFQQVASGIAILLIGMIFLERGFKSFTESRLKRYLKRATNKFYKSFSLGFFSTAILQSSSLISIISISFISAGLIGLSEGIAIIFGSNLGTTSTAWIVAWFGLKLKISLLAAPVIVFGTVLLFQKTNALKGLGNVLIGLGFFFLGIHFMKEGFDTTDNGLDLTAFSLSGFGGGLLMILFGVLITVVLQSSSAAMAIIITALAAGQISYFDAMIVAIGANIGTTVTALIGAGATNPPGKRLAGAHLIFNVITAIVALVFINQLSWIVQLFADMVGWNEGEYALKLAAFHSLFNILGIIIMLPWVGKLVRFLNKVIPDKDPDEDGPQYLNDLILDYPLAAVHALIQETKHLFSNTFEIMAHALGVHRSEVLDTTMLEHSVQRKYSFDVINIDEVYVKKIKLLYGKIMVYATRVQIKTQNAQLIHVISNIKEANRYFVEAIKELNSVQSNFIRFSRSTNQDIKNEYDRMRMRIIRVIRQVLKAQDFTIPDGVDQKEMKQLTNAYIEHRQQKLAKYWQINEESDVLFDGTMERLIDQDLISSSMASSLINDNAISTAIIQKLLRAVELLYLNTDTLLLGFDKFDFEDEQQQFESKIDE